MEGVRLDGEEFYFGGVEGDGGGRGVESEVDGFGTAEGGGVKVGSEGEGVVAGVGVGGEALGANGGACDEDKDEEEWERVSRDEHRLF